jgi:hypothetical protein
MKAGMVELRLRLLHYARNDKRMTGWDGYEGIVA